MFTIIVKVTNLSHFENINIRGEFFFYCLIMVQRIRDAIIYTISFSPSMNCDYCIMFFCKTNNITKIPIYSFVIISTLAFLPFKDIEIFG